MVNTCTCTVTAGEDGLTTIVTIERATLSTVSPHPYSPPLTPVPATDGLLGGGLSNWPSPEQWPSSDERQQHILHMYKIVGILGKKCSD